MRDPFQIILPNFVEYRDFSQSIFFRWNEKYTPSDRVLHGIISPDNWVKFSKAGEDTNLTSCWASSLGSQHDATYICCWAPAPCIPAIDQYLLQVPAHSSKPAARRCFCRSTDRQTHGHPTVRLTQTLLRGGKIFSRAVKIQETAGDEMFWLALCTDNLDATSCACTCINSATPCATAEYDAQKQSGYTCHHHGPADQLHLLPDQDFTIYHYTCSREYDMHTYDAQLSQRDRATISASEYLVKCCI